jgi:hypothetical protein
MTQKVLGVESQSSMAEAARIMQRERIGALPVLDGGRLVGILTRSDLLRAFVTLTDFRAKEFRRMHAKSTDKLSVEAAAALIRPRDSVLCGFAAGQPVGLLEALGSRTDLEDVTIFTGLLIRPFRMLQNPGVRIMSGFFGPIEPTARGLGMPVEYLPADFHGLERLAYTMKPRVVLAVTTPPDAEGWLNFGVTAGASYRAFVEGCRCHDGA